MFSSEQHGLASIILVKATIKDSAVQINSGAQNDTILLNISKSFDRFLHRFTTRAYDNGQSLDIFSQIKHMPNQIKLDRQIFLHYQRVPFFKGYKFCGFHGFSDFHEICFTENHWKSYHDTDCRLKTNVDL